ncbi:MAG: FixH family protein [candidate division NC10 bacterium]
MTRSIRRAVLVLLVAGALGAPAWGAELKPIHTATAKDVVVTLLSESGQWMAGPNSFVVEFVSAKTKQPLDVGKVTLNTSMAMRGMAPMTKSATVTPDKTPGRYLATISFPDVGAREVTVNWDGLAGKGSARLSVNVR